MKYIALLRGINAGKLRRVEMKGLKSLFESLGFVSVSAYINSGNVIFESSKSKPTILREIAVLFKKEFDFEIPILIKTQNEMKKIANAIPKEWGNDSMQRSDVAYLFPEIDFKKTIDDLPVKKEFLDIRYVKGAIFWNIDRKNYNKSHLNKIISHKSYQFMTVRNVNTARYLAGNNMSTKTKIKITDNSRLRTQIDDLYQKTNQIVLAKWSLKIAKRILEAVGIDYKKNDILVEGFKVNELWQNGKARMHDVRQAGFKIHKLAHDSDSEIQKSAFRTVGHAVASGHMKEHAMVASDYAIKTIGLITSNDMDAITREREWQLKALNKLKQSI